MGIDIRDLYTFLVRVDEGDAYSTSDVMRVCVSTVGVA